MLCRQMLLATEVDDCDTLPHTTLPRDDTLCCDRTNDHSWRARFSTTGFTSISQGGFHGRTYGAMALTTSKTVYRQGFAPLMPQVR